MTVYAAVAIHADQQGLFIPEQTIDTPQLSMLADPSISIPLLVDADDARQLEVKERHHVGIAEGGRVSSATGHCVGGHSTDPGVLTGDKGDGVDVVLAVTMDHQRTTVSVLKITCARKK